MSAVARSVLPDRPRRLTPAALSEPARILSRDESEALFKRIVALASGSGDTQVTIRSRWTTSLRWGRNRPSGMWNTVVQFAEITRFQEGLKIQAILSRLSTLNDATIKQTVQQLDAQLASSQSPPAGDRIEPLERQEYLTPPIWSDATYRMTPRELSDAIRQTVVPVIATKLMAAGYVELGAVSWAIFNTRGLDAYAQATGAMYSETVRMPDGSGSGWAGRSHYDWAKLDASALSATALQKCRDSANPVKIEPGRYTAILEPKATAIMMWEFVNSLDNIVVGGKKGQQVLDNRLTVTSDPMDPDCSFIPFDPEGHPYRKVTWVENGILKAFPTKTPALPNPGAFRMSGGDTSIEEMIATTERGIYVTHFGDLWPADTESLSGTSMTRDGLWLVEHGKIIHPIKNLWIYESPLFIFNRVLQLGKPVRTIGVYEFAWGGHIRTLPSQALNNGNMPVVAPAAKVQDMNFTRLIDAI